MEGSPEGEKSKQWPQILAVMTTLILVMSTGTHGGWTSPAIPKLLENDMDFSVTKDQTSYLVFLYPLGYIIASPITPFFLESMGRKCALLCLAFPQILAWILIAAATKVEVLYISRLISGFAEANVFSILPVYICEVAEPFIRGRLGICFTTAFTFGFFLINAYGSFMRLRASACVSICWSLLFLCTFIWMPETPYYCLIKGDTESARTSLKRLRRMNNVETELAKLTSDVQAQVSESTTLKDVFYVRSNLKALGILMGLRTLQLFSGGPSILYYVQPIFGEVSGGVGHSISAIIFTGCLTVVTGSALILVDRYGRRPLLLISVSGTSMCLLIVTIYFILKFHGYDITNLHWMPITGMILFTILRGFGLSSIPTLMAGELFSAKIKGKAMGILTIYVSLMLSGTSKAFHVLEDNYGMHVPFATFTVLTVFGVLFVYFCIPETKGKTLEEIQLMLK